MKNVPEYLQRRIVLAEARKLYIKTGKTNNISTALKWHLETLPEEERIPLHWPASEEILQHSPLDDYIRPRCPECEYDLFLKSQCTGLGQGDRITVWVCKVCGHKDYSELTVQEWLEILPRKEEV